MGNISTSFVDHYRGELVHLVQQKRSRLRGAVREEPQNAENAYYEQIGVATITTVTVRHQATVLNDPAHERRRVSLVDSVAASGIDSEDKEKQLIEPKNAYVMAQAMAMLRGMDDAIIAAALGTAYTGKTGSTSTTFPAAQQVASGGTGLTLGKLRNAKMILDAGETDPDETRYICVSAQQIDDMLGLTEVTSSDFASVKALVQGQVNSFLGFEFIRSERLALNGSSERRCFAWVKSGLLLAVATDIYVDIGPRRDLNNMTQVLSKMGIGATRMEEAKVVEIPCA